MTYILDGEEYDDLEDFMTNGDFSLPITVFLEEEIELINKHDGQGKYIFTMNGPDVDENIEYEFVYIFTYDDESPDDEEKDIPYLALYPSKIPDETLLKFLDALQYDEDDPLNEFDKTTKLQIEYIPFESDDYITNDDELITFEGEIRKIQEDDVYIKNDDGNNYQILPNCEEEIELCGLWINIAHFMEDEYNKNLYHQMKEDNFMGKFIRTFVDNRGHIHKEIYTIELVRKDALFLENYDVPPYWSNIAPSFIWDKNNTITLCGRLVHEIYIPHSEYDKTTLNTKDHEEPSQKKDEYYNKLMLKLNLIDNKTKDKYDIEVYPMKKYDFKIIFTSPDKKELITLPEGRKRISTDVNDWATIYSRNKVEIHWNGGFMKAMWTDVKTWLGYTDDEHLYPGDSFEYDDYIVYRHFPDWCELDVLDYTIDEEAFRVIMDKDFYEKDILDQLLESLPPKK